MKRIAALLLAAAMILSFAACGEKETEKRSWRSREETGSEASETSADGSGGLAFISKQDEAADAQLLDSIKTAAVFAFTERHLGEENAVVTSIEVDAKALSTVYINGESEPYDISGYIGTDSRLKTMKGATWTKEGDWEYKR